MVKRAIIILMLLGLFLVACSNQEAFLSKQPIVKLFYAVNHNVTYSESSFSGNDAKAVTSLASGECKGIGDSFTISTYKSDAFILTVYSSKSNISCILLKPNVVRGIVEKNKSDAPDNDTLVIVNGAPITKNQLLASISALPNDTDVDVNTELQLLNNLIDKELLKQEQEKMNVSAADVARVRQNLLSQLQINESELSVLLQNQNIDQATFDSQVVSQAKLEKLFSTKLLADEINVSEADAKAYYMANTNQFLISEQAVMRHIYLRGATKDYSQKASAVQSALDNGTDFCELVKEYSDDNDSISKCGIYTIPRGVIDPSLERAAFTTPANHTSRVATADGLHFVQTLQVTQTQVVPYNKVENSLEMDLRNAQFQQRLNFYLTSLRAQSDIVTFFR